MHRLHRFNYKVQIGILRSKQWLNHTGHFIIESITVIMMLVFLFTKTIDITPLKHACFYPTKNWQYILLDPPLERCLWNQLGFQLTNTRSTMAAQIWSDPIQSSARLSRKQPKTKSIVSIVWSVNSDLQGRPRMRATPPVPHGRFPSWRCAEWHRPRWGARPGTYQLVHACQTEATNHRRRSPVTATSLHRDSEPEPAATAGSGPVSVSSLVKPPVGHGYF
jgi:hypothetical protein